MIYQKKTKTKINEQYYRSFAEVFSTTLVSPKQKIGFFPINFFWWSVTFCDQHYNLLPKRAIIPDIP